MYTACPNILLELLAHIWLLFCPVMKKVKYGCVVATYMMYACKVILKAVSRRIIARI